MQQNVEATLAVAVAIFAALAAAAGSMAALAGLAVAAFAAALAYLRYHLQQWSQKVLEALEEIQIHTKFTAEKQVHIECRVDWAACSINDASRHLQQHMEKHDLQQANPEAPWLRLERQVRELHTAWSMARPF